MKRRILLLMATCILALSSNAHSQSKLDQKVTISFMGSLENLLTHLSTAYGVNLSYSADNTPLDKAISIKASDLPLRSFIERLCRKAGLAYRLVDGHIALRGGLFTGTVPLNQAEEGFEPTAPDDSSRGFRPIEAKQPLNPFDSIALEPLIERPDGAKIVVMPIKRRTFKTHYRDPVNLAIGLLASYDCFQFNFKVRANEDQKYCPGKSFSLGVSGILAQDNAFTASIALLLSTKNYHLDYNYRMNDPNDPFPVPARTTVRLSYIGFPISVNYRAFRTGNLYLYLSGGLTAELLVHEEESTGFLNAKEKATEYFTGNHRFLWGGSMGIKLRYRFSQSVSVFLKPGYVHYFTPLNDTVMRAGPQALKLKTGINFNFKLFKQLYSP